MWPQNVALLEMYYKVNLATVVEGDQKAHFLIATTPGVGEGEIPFPGLIHITPDW